MQLIEISRATEQAIVSTWDSIASDAYEICDGDNSIAMEMVLDANRLTFAGFEASDREIRALCLEHGFGLVCDVLSRRIQLL
jgi:hypothetical protein